jgi:hypothetical protein
MPERGWTGVSILGTRVLRTEDPAAVAAALFGLGQWAFADMRDHAFLGPQHGGGPQGQMARPGVPHAIVGGGTSGSGATS